MKIYVNNSQLNILMSFDPYRSLLIILMEENLVFLEQLCPGCEDLNRWRSRVSRKQIESPLLIYRNGLRKRNGFLFEQ